MPLKNSETGLCWGLWQCKLKTLFKKKKKSYIVFQVFVQKLWRLWKQSSLEIFGNWTKFGPKERGPWPLFPPLNTPMPTPSGYCKNRLRKNTFLRPQVLPSIVRDLTVEKFTFFYYPVKEKQEVYAYRQAHGLTSETWHCHVMRSRVRNNTPAKPTSLQDAQGRGGNTFVIHVRHWKTWEISHA